MLLRAQLRRMRNIHVTTYNKFSIANSIGPIRATVGKDEYLSDTRYVWQWNAEMREDLD